MKLELKDKVLLEDMLAWYEDHQDELADEGYDLDRDLYDIIVDVLRKEW